MLVSANALYNHKTHRFRTVPHDLFSGGDIALDSAGFVAMAHYKAYPWQPADYVGLAGSYPWTWWASMDYCCEPEIAADRSVVKERVTATADMLATVRGLADSEGVAEPMPVLQGWLVADYLESVGLVGEVLGEWPGLVGVGSMCRRQPRSALSIVEALHDVLPLSVGLHLFGAKSDIIPLLGDVMAAGRRIESDSMAWDQACRMDRPGTLPNSVDVRACWAMSFYWRTLAGWHAVPSGQGRLTL
jgi:hypothetical protein